jgi:DNA-binding transcriptional ArsR family regulator
VLELLRERPARPAGEIAAHFPSAARPGVSRHLRVLRECGLVRAHRHGREWRYDLEPGPLVDLRDGWLAEFSRHHVEALRSLRRRVERGAGADD